MEKYYLKINYQSNPENKEQYRKRYQEIPELHKKNLKSGNGNIDNKANKAENFLHQVQQGPYYIFTICQIF